MSKCSSCKHYSYCDIRRYIKMFETLLSHTFGPIELEVSFCKNYKGD